MNKRKFAAVFALVVGLVSISFFIPRGSVEATPLLQMTPGTDPMSVPTVGAPTPQPGDFLTNPITGTMGTTCPMMGGSMTGNGAMMGGTGMSGMSMGMQGMGMQSMQGMDMQTMQGMGGMGGMSQMGSMPTAGMGNINDQLYNGSRAGWFYSLNPWWLLGWLFLFGLVFSLLIGLVFVIIWLARQPRRDRPSEAG
jgi:hypothetical protein